MAIIILQVMEKNIETQLQSQEPKIIERERALDYQETLQKLLKNPFLVYELNDELIYFWQPKLKDALQRGIIDFSQQAMLQGIFQAGVRERNSQKIYNRVISTRKQRSEKNQTISREQKNKNKTVHKQNLEKQRKQQPKKNNSLDNQQQGKKFCFFDNLKKYFGKFGKHDQSVSNTDQDQAPLMPSNNQLKSVNNCLSLQPIQKLNYKLPTQ